MSLRNPLEPWAEGVVDGYTVYRRPALGGGLGAGGAGGSGTELTELPTVLLLNGCALPAAGWMTVAEGLPGFEILALDRPGFAGTRWDGRIPDLASEVAMVARALAGIERGAILVAHSMASFRAEALARLRPELVAGIVLVDPSVESFSDRGLASRFAPASWLHVLGDMLSPVLIRELASSLSHRGFLSQIASEIELDRTVFKEPYADPETLKSAFAEWLSYREQAVDLATLRARTARPATPASAIFALPAPGTRRRAVLARSLTHLVTIDLVDSGHLMMIDCPDAIIRAVEAVVRRSRRTAG